MLELADQPIRTVLALAAHCGLRKGEVLELRRKDITTEEEPDGPAGSMSISLELLSGRGVYDPWLHRHLRPNSPSVHWAFISCFSAMVVKPGTISLALDSSAS